jgi:hypothetical protein
MDHEFIDPWTKIPRFIARLSASASSLQSLSSEAFITNIAAWFSNLERAHTHNGAGQLQGHGIKVTEIAPGMVDTGICASSDHPRALEALKVRKFEALTSGRGGGRRVCCPGSTQLLS